MTMERTVSRMIMTTVIQMVIQMERIPYGTLPRRVLLPVSMAKVEQEVRKEHQLPDLFLLLLLLWEAKIQAPDKEAAPPSKSDFSFFRSFSSITLSFMSGSISETPNIYQYTAYSIKKEAGACFL